MLLYELGGKVSEVYDKLRSEGKSAECLNVSFLSSEAERFQLWAHSLGLYHEGHASLDYRVRDTVVVKNRFSELLQELIDHSENLLSIATGERKPAEEMEELRCHDSPSSSPSSDNESPSEVPSDGSSFNEVKFRNESLKERLDALYSLATRIRNPTNRQSRPIDQLYEHIPAADREAHIHECEELETNVISYILRQDIEALSKRLSEDALLRYTSHECWLVRRTGTANSRRKQQLLYWKDHPMRLPQHGQSHDRKDTLGIVPFRQDTNSNREIIPPTTPSELNPTTLSLATSAIAMKSEDLESVTSTQSCLSTVIDVRNKKLDWPPPPKPIDGGGYFECPYCRTTCPARYLKREAWEDHLIHDLQAYHCTYEVCRDRNRLYGSRQEWIDHESQHNGIWYCAKHDIEYETQPEYMDHLKVDHAGEYFSEELLGTAVHASMKIHRDCPFCPTVLSDSSEMRDHVAFHLKRLALLALTSAENTSANNDASAWSADSQQD